MNKKIKLITVLSAAALVTGLVSCGEVNNSSAEASSEASSSVAKVATRISHDSIDYVTVGEEVDLDKYITIKYDDNTTDKTYDVTCASSDVTINGHKVKASTHGEFTLVVKAGTVTAKITLSVVSEEHKELIDFLAPLSDTPNNYTLYAYDINNGSLEYQNTYVHNENYIAIYDETDPGAVYGSDSQYAGESKSTILAKLSDGHTYWGNFEGTKTDYKPVFEPGYATWENYYITGDLTVDATDATYETGTSTSGTTTEYLMMGTDFEARLLNYGMSTFPTNYGYSLAGAEFGGIYDTDGDNVNDMALFTCYVSNGTQMGYWTIVGIGNIGTSTIDIMETAIKDAKYLPTKIAGTEISTVFKALAEKKNYTVTLDLSSCDSSGSALDLTDYSKDCLANMYGSTHVTMTTTFTENGVISTMEYLELVKDDDGNYTPGTNTKIGAKFATWDDGTNTYTSTYNTTTGAMSDATTVAENKTVYNSGAIDGITADNVTEDDANGTIWSSKKSSGTTVTFVGNVGDNDGTEVTNSLFGKIFDMNGFSSTLISSIGAAGFGTNLTTPVEFTSGDSHALSMYSSYNYFTVDTTTNEVSISALCYLPIGLSDYILAKLTITNVGTTTNDFSGFTTSGSSSSSTGE